MLFGGAIAFMDYSLGSTPPQVALIVDGKPHYGALRTYDWESAGGGGGNQWIGKIPEVINIQNGSEISVRASWDRRFVELSCVKLEDNTCIVYQQKNNIFTINLEQGQHRLYVTTIWAGRLHEQVVFEYQVNVS